MRAGDEFGKPGDNARRRGNGGQHSFAPQAPMTPISRVNRDIFHDIARRKGARARVGSVTLSHPAFAAPAPPPPPFPARFSPATAAARHSADPSEVDEKFFRVVIPGVIATRRRRVENSTM